MQELKHDGETIAMQFDTEISEEKRKSIPDVIPVQDDSEDEGLQIFTIQGMDVFFVGYKDESLPDDMKFIASFDEREDAEWYKEWKSDI